MPCRSLAYMVFYVTMLHFSFYLLFFTLTFQQQSLNPFGMRDSTLLFTEKDHQKEVQVTLEDTLVIALEARPGTGYIWTLPTVPDILELIKESSEQTAALPGGMERQYFYFRPIQTGAGQIILHYQQPWEKEISSTFSLHVMISS